jgi:hypothetical protein
MTKRIIWALILIAALSVGAYFIFFDKSGTTTNNPADNNTSGNNNEEGIIQDFSTSNQTVGQASTSKFTIEDVTNTSKTSYHEISFALSSDGSDSPYVTASYVSNLGVIRMGFKQVEKDGTGLGYQKGLDINNQGVVRIYHNISSDQTEEIYDIGVTGQTPFRLSVNKSDGKWVVTLDVKYIKGSTIADIDKGSTDFSTNAQTISGVASVDGAAINSYSFATIDNGLQFVWNVSSDVSNPIPSVKAEYDSSSNLVLTFASLETDKIINSVNNLDLPGSIVLTTARNSDGSSIYSFTNLEEPVQYKLSASTSPNQVVLEIKF